MIISAANQGNELQVDSKKIKLAMLAAGNSIHTVRWANSLQEAGYDVRLITMHKPLPGLDSEIKVDRLPIPAPLGYFLNTPFLRRILKRDPPDILHTHFAAGYGTLGRQSGFHPNVLSVWGSDVYEFPKRSKWHFKTIRKTINAADWICSTSQAMAEQTRSIEPEIRNMSITPFGIDVEKFSKNSVPVKGAHHSGEIVIGTVKTLKPTYGIDILIRGFAMLRNKLIASGKEFSNSIRLRIVGGGPDQIGLEALAKSLDLTDVCDFVGEVAHDKVVDQLNRLDIYVAVSRNESFGVSVLEASSFGLPVVVSNVGGLPEIVEHGVTGLIIPTEDPASLANSLSELVQNETLRKTMGRNGRNHVIETYSWNQSVRIMDSIYQNLPTLQRTQNDPINQPVEIENQGGV